MRNQLTYLKHVGQRRQQSICLDVKVKNIIQERWRFGEQRVKGPILREMGDDDGPHARRTPDVGPWSGPFRQRTSFFRQRGRDVFLRDKGRVSSHDQKRVCSRGTRFQPEQEILLSHKGMIEVSERAREWSEHMKRV